jgi:gluconate 2-dehydrogenase gamma chain
LNEDDDMRDHRVNRRQLLAAGAALGAVPARAHTITGEMPWAPATADAPRPIEPGPYQFFQPEEAKFIEAAVERLIPSDELGPGARDVGVPTFIDRQLAGQYGHAQRWYMLGPWRPGVETQGYQSRLAPAQMYRFAIKAIDAHVREKNQNRSFAELSPEDQDKILQSMENDELKLQGVSTKAFFEVLLQNTVEGFFSDPIYGGNRDMAAWKMIGFPGARYDYRDYVDKHGEHFPLPPVGLKGRPEWNPKA